MICGIPNNRTAAVQRNDNNTTRACATLIYGLPRLLISKSPKFGPRANTCSRSDLHRYGQSCFYPTHYVHSATRSAVIVTILRNNTHSRSGHTYIYKYTMVRVISIVSFYIFSPRRWFLKTHRFPLVYNNNTVRGAKKIRVGRFYGLSGVLVNFF